MNSWFESGFVNTKSATGIFVDKTLRFIDEDEVKKQTKLH